MTAPRVLVFGAENFIGSRIVAALAASGSWTPSAADGRAEHGPDLLRGVHAIVNAAVGGPRFITAQARLALAAAQTAGAATRLVHVSSMTVYGAQSGRVTETTPTVPDLGAYGAAHIAAEGIAGSHGNTVILRPGCEYGPGCEAWSERIGRLLLARRLGDMGAAGDGYCNLIYIDDLADAVLACLRAPANGLTVFNLAMRSPPRWNEYLIRFGVALRAVPVPRIGARALRWEAKVMAAPRKLVEIGARRLGGGGSWGLPLTPSLLRLCGQEIVLASDRAEETLCIRWMPLDEGIARAAAAFER